MTRFNFDLGDDVYKGDGAAAGGAPVPEGDYRLTAVDAELKNSSTGGKYISVEFDFVDPPYDRRKMWMNFNVENKSAKAEEIGRRQVAAWARSCGKPNAKSTDDLIGKMFMAAVVIEPGTDGYKDKNIISSFRQPDTGVMPSDARPAAAPAPAPRPSSPAPAGGQKAAKAPWDD